MQNVPQNVPSDDAKLLNNVQNEIGNNHPSTPQSTTTSNSSPAKSETETYSEHHRFMSETSESEEDSVSEVESFMIDQEFEEDAHIESSKFLLNPEDDRTVDPETQARLEALLQAAGIGQLAAKDGKHLGDPEVLRRLTSSVSCALDEAAAALTRMRSDNPNGRPQNGTSTATQQLPEKTSLVEACNDGDVGTVRKLLTEGRSVHETSEEGESLLSLACSAGYFELAQVLLAMHANVEDRGIKGECTPLMEAASAGHLDIVRLLVAHGADVNAQSTTGNTPLMYGCAGGHTEVVKFLLENGANVEDHNENGHTPLMEAASAGHVGLAKILLMHGAGINTHSNEFKESALTLACYKGHLDMVRFLLEAGADQEHKTDEMHTALMEASMDGHVEVARLLLDSGAQVNMPTDSFESPLTLAACGGHVDLAMLLIERGANIEEVNDEGYTPLMEAAREGHEEMVHLLLGQGANINAQTDETQETALTLACCGGFTEVADILLKGGADIELGASTPLMEAAQEGHLDLVRFLLENNGNVHAQTQTGDTALTYACENGHTDVADLLLQYGADLEHESEGGRTPLMKACRAGHLCTVQFLISKGANVRRQTTNNDHTPLSLACAGGHLTVVELLLSHNADPNHKLKDNSTMLIEAAKGGHTNVVQLLLDYPHSMQPMVLNQHQQAAAATTATNLSMLPGQVGSRDSPLPPGAMPPHTLPPLRVKYQLPAAAVIQEAPDAIEIVQQVELNNPPLKETKVKTAQQQQQTQPQQAQQQIRPNEEQWSPNEVWPKSMRRSKNRANGSVAEGNLTSAEVQQVRSQPITFEEEAIEFFNKEDPNSTLIDFIKNRKKPYNSSSDEGSTQKQQILEELHRVERELHGKQQQAQQQAAQQAQQQAQQQNHNPLFYYPQDDISPNSPNANNTLPHLLNIDVAMQQQKQQQQGLGASMLSGCASPFNQQQQLQVTNAFYTGGTNIGNATALKLGGDTATPSCLQSPTLKLAVSGDATPYTQPSATQQPAFYFAPLGGGNLATATQPSVGVSLPTNAVAVSTTTTGIATSISQPIKFQSVAAHTEVSQNTAVSDRPKVKPFTKKEGKNLRKQQTQQQQQVLSATNQKLPTFQPNPYTSSAPGGTGPQQPQPPPQLFGQLQLTNQQPALNINQSQAQQVFAQNDAVQQDILNVQRLDLTSISQNQLLLQGEQEENLLTASILQQFHNTSIPFIGAASVGSPQKTRLELYDPTQEGNKVTKLELTERDFTNVDDVVQTLEVQPYPSLDESMIASLTAQQDLQTPTDLSRIEYFAVPGNGSQVPVHTLYQYGTQYLAPGIQNPMYEAGFKAGFNHSLMQQQLACPSSAGVAESLTTTTAVVVPSSVGGVVTPPGTSLQQSQQIAQQTQQQIAQQSQQMGQQQFITAPAPQVQQQQSQQQQVCVVGQQGGGQQHHCQPCSQHQQQLPAVVSQQQHHQNQQQQQASTQVQAATQTSQTAVANADAKKTPKVSENFKFKKGRLLRHQNQNQNNFQQDQNYQIDHNSAITQYSGANRQQCANAVIAPCMDVDSATESNHDTALTLACAGGHEELVELLISRGADIEHRDKKGFTPLILAATAGHEKVVEILLNHNADIEAQSERTKDTPLSLACSGGRYEVVELLLNRNANKEHRNVSDYTPLSLAASGGYVNIIKLLLSHGAEINSRTGSKLGISPLMLAAMNGHTAAVKLLLDMGSDINAQIETNRNTALTLACFQGRHEVVSLLLDRKANVEHRAKTGLTPLMEAASGGYVDVGRVLLDKGADVNATPVPSSRDTALTIAADKGHVRFVELLLCRGAQVEVKNKKGNSPLWLAANGGHLPVVEILYNVKADIDSQDNRKVSCLMAAFRKGHVKVVKWMVHHVTQFPSDQEMSRYMSTISDKELSEKCHECVKIIRAAKETQAARANKNASILLEELESEKTREESKRLAAARRRERKKKKKLEKKEERRKLLEENKKNENYDEKQDAKKLNDDDKPEEEESNVVAQENNQSNRSGGGDLNNMNDKEEGDSGIDANSQGSCSSNDIKAPKEKRKNKKNKKTTSSSASKKEDAKGTKSGGVGSSSGKNASDGIDKDGKNKSGTSGVRKGLVFEATVTKSPADRDDFEATGNEVYVSSSSKSKKSEEYSNTSSNGTSMGNSAATSNTSNSYNINKSVTNTSPKQSSSKREEGWKEVVRKSSVQTVSESGVKKVAVPLNAISRVIGRGGSNINAIRAATGAHIEVEKQSKGGGQGERIITIKGTSDASKQAHSLITALIKDPDVDISTMLPKTSKSATSATTLWDKTQIGTKKNAGKVGAVASSTVTTLPNPHQKTIQTVAPTISQPNRFATTYTIKFRGTAPVVSARVTAPRLVAQAEKNAAQAAQQQLQQQLNHQNQQQQHQTSSGGNVASNRMTSAMSSSSSTSGPNRSGPGISGKSSNASLINQTFAAKLTETTAGQSALSSGGGVGGAYISSTNQKARNLGVPHSGAGPVSPQAQAQILPTAHATGSPNKSVRPAPTASAPPTMQHYQNNTSKPPSAFVGNSHATPTEVGGTMRSSTPNIIQHQEESSQPALQTTSEYTLFYTGDHWNRREAEQHAKPINFAAVTGGGGNSAQSVTQHKFIEEPPPQVDASKAPGYRGVAACSPVSSKTSSVAVCSPISSKTSSNSTTPPASNVGASYQTYQETPSKSQRENLPPIGSNIVHNRVSVSSQNNPQPDYNTLSGFMDFNKTVPNMLNFNNDAHLFSPMQNLTGYSQPPQQPQQPPINIQQSASMSRLNPKAPEYSSSVYNSVQQQNKSTTVHAQLQQQQNQQNQQQNQQNQHVYNGYQMNVQQSANNMFPKMDGFQGSRGGGAGLGVGGASHNRSWMLPQQPGPYQSDIIAGLAGMTIHNLQAKFQSTEGLENGAELGMVNNSPHMSPNMAPPMPLMHDYGVEDRKPQPIGTERARKAYGGGLDQNWMDKQQAKWLATHVEFGIRNPPMYEEDMLMRPIHVDNFANGPNYFNPPLPGVRHDFIPEMPKLDLSWDNTPRPMSELQDKQHGWTNQWNK